MKIKPDHYQHLKAHIAPLLPRLGAYRAALVADNYPGDISKCVRWYAVNTSGLLSWMCDTLYAYLNDDHIDTALRRIQSELAF